MLKKCKYIPKLETDRLILREISEKDTEDLRKWLGRDELYTYWGYVQRRCVVLLSSYSQKQQSIDYREMQMSGISVRTGCCKRVVLF